jgi:hypothetical protein
MCCGRSRSGARAAGPYRYPTTSTASPARPGTGPTFEYIGQAGATVVGPVTGARYRFDRPGARLQVDTRDKAALARVAVLRLVG